MVPIFSSGLASTEHRRVQIEGIFQSQIHSAKGHWLLSYLGFINYIYTEGQVLVVLTALASAALKAQPAPRPVLI